MDARELDVRRCEACGQPVRRGEAECASCGRAPEALAELMTPGRVAATIVPLGVALVVWMTLPSSWLEGPARALAQALVLALGSLPLGLATARVVRRQRRRSPHCREARRARLEARLDALADDLAATEGRLEAARGELQTEVRPRLREALIAEIAHDERLRWAQRELAAQVEARQEQLAVEHFRAELIYYEACRDAGVKAPAEAEALAERIAEVRAERAGGETAAWEAALEDAQALQRQLARGVERLHAARRLDPLAYADLAASAAGPGGFDEAGWVSLEASLERDTELHLERIDRGLEALAELDLHLRAHASPDESGLRLRVDDALLLDLELEEEEAHASTAGEPEGRISAPGF